jgi:serine/threonine protein phosphatase PrpC
MKGEIIMPKSRRDGEGSQDSGDGDHSNSGKGPKPRRKPSWYERCFAIRKDKFQPSEEMQRISRGERGLPEQRDQRIEAPPSGRPATRDQANHREATRENTRIKQRVEQNIKEAEKTFEEAYHLLSKLHDACYELTKSDNNEIKELVTNIANISKTALKKIDEQSLTFQNACDELKIAANQLEMDSSLGVTKRARNEFDKHLASVQRACNELRKTKDQLETLRDFLYLRKQVNEARTQLEADLGEATDGNPRRIKELARNIENRIESAFNDESLDNPWMLKKACEELRKGKDQLEVLRKASHAWKQVDQIKVESIGMLSGTIKDAARMQAEMAGGNFEQFLSSLEQHPVHDNRWQLDKTWFESNYQKLKDIVVGDLKHRWKVLAESRKILFKDYEDLATSSMQETTEKYGQFAVWLGEEDFSRASKHIGQLAEGTLSYKGSGSMEDDSASENTTVSEGSDGDHPSQVSHYPYEFKHKAVERSRRTKMVDSLRALLHMTERNHRDKRVEGIVNEFNNTLEEMRDKLDAIPEKLRHKVVEDTVTIMKDFKISYDDALYGYGKHKGRKTRKEGEKRIKELSKRISEMSKDLSRWHFVQDTQRELEQASVSYTNEERQSLHKSWDGIGKSYERVLDACRQESDQSDARAQYELARQDFLETKDQIYLRKVGKKLVEVYDPIVERIEVRGESEYDKSIIKYVNDYKEYKQSICEKLSIFLDKKYIYTACKMLEELKCTNERVAEDLKAVIQSLDPPEQSNLREFIDTDIDDKLKDMQRGCSDYSEGTSGACTLGDKKPSEDAYFSSDEYNVHAVFDGVSGKVGGGSGGHIASAIAVDCLRQSAHRLSDNLSVEEIREQMSSILKEINAKICEHQDGIYSEMATTASIVKIMKDGTAVTGNVGDSRVYLLRNKSKSLDHLTLDDNGLSKAVKLAERDPWKMQKSLANDEDYRTLAKRLLQVEVIPELERLKVHLELDRPLIVSWGGLTKALGFSGSVESNIYTHQLKPGDRVIITSDGMHDVLIDDRIANCILENDGDIQEAVEALVQEAEDEKGTSREKKDDRTVILARYYRKCGDNAQVFDGETVQNRADNSLTNYSRIESGIDEDDIVIDL